MNIKLDVTLNNIELEDLEDVVYDAGNNLISRNFDALLPRAHFSATQEVSKSLSRNASKIFNVLDSYKFTIDNFDRNVENESWKYITRCIEDTLQRLFVTNMIYIIDGPTTEIDVTYYVSNGDLLLFYKDNYAVLLNNKCFGTTILDIGV